MDQKHLDFNDTIFNGFLNTGARNPKLPLPDLDPRYQGGYVNYPDNTWGTWYDQSNATYMQVYYLDTAKYLGLAKKALDGLNFFIHPQAIYPVS